MYAEKLLEFVPDFLRNSKIFSNVQDIQQDEIYLIDEALIDIKKQLSPLTCTWSIDKWEQEFGISKTTDDLELRRAIVISKLATSTPLTPKSLESILSNFAEDVNVTNISGEYRFKVILTIKNNFSLTMNEVKNVIQDVKPAHLVYDLEFGFIDEVGIEFEMDYYIHECYICGMETISNDLMM